MTAPHGWTDSSVDADARPSYRRRLRDTAQALALAHIQRKLARAYADSPDRSGPATAGARRELRPAGTTAARPGDNDRALPRVPHFDRDRLALLSMVHDALRLAGVTWEEERRPWSERPLWHVDADPWTVWHALRRARRAAYSLGRDGPGDHGPSDQGPGDQAPGLQVRPRQRSTPARSGRTSLTQRPWPRWLTRLLTAEFIETHLADPRLGSVVTLADPCPAGDEWLVSREPRHDDPLSARLATEAGLDLSFRTRRRERAVLTFPVDVVYTWVDASDPDWQVERDAHPPGPDVVAAATAEARFVQGGELRYSLRSIEQFAPWVRRIWVVTSGQRPEWLLDHPKVAVVTHDELWPDPHELPVFNSHAIEANLHRIDGLADHYLYLNDDMFLGRPVSPEHFFTADGRPQVFPSRYRVAPGPPQHTDRAPDAAGKNNRDLVRLLTGRHVDWKYQHAPYAISRDLVCELESRVPEIFRRTGTARYRSITDVTVSGGLHHNYAVATGRAVVGALRYCYVDLDKDSRVRALRIIHDTRYADAFCLNAVEHAPPREEVVALLDRYFPHPAVWEDPATLGEPWVGVRPGSRPAGRRTDPTVHLGFASVSSEQLR